jgi:hypothetical protein
VGALRYRNPGAGTEARPYKWTGVGVVTASAPLCFEDGRGSLVLQPGAGTEARPYKWTGVGVVTEWAPLCFEDGRGSLVLQPGAGTEARPYKMDRRGSGHGVGVVTAWAPRVLASQHPRRSPTGDRGSRLVTLAAAFVSCCP